MVRKLAVGLHVAIADDRRTYITRRIFVDGHYIGEMGKTIQTPTAVTYGTGIITAIRGTRKNPRYRVEWPTTDALWLDAEDINPTYGE